MSRFLKNDKISNWKWRRRVAKEMPMSKNVHAQSMPYKRVLLDFLIYLMHLSISS